METKRSRMTYRLRTLLIVVTLVCVWLGWQVNVVRQRKIMLRELKTRYYAEVLFASDYTTRFPAGRPPPDRARISAVRSWLGDQAVQEIGFVPSVVKPDEEARIRRWFPEARMASVKPLEPCHPGCFPRGTLVRTPRGARPIETIEVGDMLVAYDRDGRSRNAAVTSIFRTSNRLVEIDTPAGRLVTTPQQPLCRSFSRHVPAGDLKADDEVLVWRDGAVESTVIERVTRTERVELVFNLVLADSEAFVAGGYLARSKPPASDVSGAHGASGHAEPE